MTGARCQVTGQVPGHLTGDMSLGRSHLYGLALSVLGQQPPAGGRCRRKVEEEGAGGRWRRKVQEEGAGGSCRRKVEEAGARRYEEGGGRRRNEDGGRSQEPRDRGYEEGRTGRQKLPGRLRQ